MDLGYTEKVMLENSVSSAIIAEKASMFQIILKHMLTVIWGTGRISVNVAVLPFSQCMTCVAILTGVEILRDPSSVQFVKKATPLQNI